MAQRKSLSKGLRFDVFRRDGFTCQYCGRRPPDVVLEVDHILPVAEGGTNDILNLTAACQHCNRGKGKKLLDRPQRPDADLLWLETQQEIAELRRYQKTKQAKEVLLSSVIETLQGTWSDVSGLGQVPAEHIVRQMLAKYDPEIVDAAFATVAPKVLSGYVDENSWLPYTWGTLRRMQENEEARE